MPYYLERIIVLKLLERKRVSFEQREALSDRNLYGIKIKKIHRCNREKRMLDRYNSFFYCKKI